MPLTFPDQNALLALGRNARSPDFRKKLDAALEARTLNVVISSWHLIETANTTNLDNAIELADFIDSLRPVWLLERRDIQRLDVAEDFYKFAKLKFTVSPRVTTRSAAFASLNGQKDSSRFDIASRDFVKQWIEHPEQLKVLEQTYQQNADTLPKLRELRKQGKITDEIKQRVNELLISGSLPATTPAGLEIGRETGSAYAKQADVGAIASLAVETAISEHEWRSQGGVDRNTLIDKFHLISALPCVDEVVSDDKFFHKIYPITEVVSMGGCNTQLGPALH